MTACLDSISLRPMVGPGNYGDAAVTGQYLDGSFRAARFYHPSGMEPSPDGTKLYVGDSQPGVTGWVRVLDLNTKTVSTLVSFSLVSSTGGGGGDDEVVSDLCVAPSGNIYVITNLGHSSGATQIGRVFRVTPAGSLTTLFSITNGGVIDVNDAETRLFIGKGETAFRDGNGGKLYCTNMAGAVQWQYNYGLFGGPYGGAVLYEPTLDVVYHSAGADTAGIAVATATGTNLGNLDDNSPGSYHFADRGDDCLYRWDLGGSWLISKVNKSTYYPSQVEAGIWTHGGTWQPSGFCFVGTQAFAINIYDKTVYGISVSGWQIHRTR